MLTSHPDAYYQVSVQEKKQKKKKKKKKKKKEFYECDHGGHLGLPVGTILAIFYLQVTPMLPTKFHINLPFGSGAGEK